MSVQRVCASDDQGFDLGAIEVGPLEFSAIRFDPVQLAPNGIHSKLLWFIRADEDVFDLGAVGIGAIDDVLIVTRGPRWGPRSSSTACLRWGLWQHT